MRIALVTDGLACGGAERQIVVSASELARRGHDVDVVAYHSVNDFGSLLASRGVNHVVVGGRFGLRAERIGAMARHFKARRFDVVHAFKDTPSIWGRAAAKLARVPVILGGYRMRARVDPISRLAHRVLSWREAGYVVLSQSAKEVVVADFGVPANRVFVVYNAVDPTTYQSDLTRDAAKVRLDIAPDQLVVSLVANLRPEKNHELFFEMARRVLTARPTAVFLVVGDGPRAAAVRALADRSRLGRSLRLLGHQERIADVWRATDVAVITSDHEGLCSVLTEAGAAAIPCVSTDNGGSKEVLVDGRTGFIVPLRDPEAMAKRVQLLLDDEALRGRMGTSARVEALGRFSIAAMGDGLIDAYTASQRRLGLR